MLQVNTSSHPNYKSINNVSTDLDQNKSSKQTWPCVTMAGMVIIIIGICLLIYNYGFNDGQSFDLNALIMNNLNVNDEEINDANENEYGIKVSSDSAQYSWSIIGVSDLDMLSDGDIITIRGFYSGFFENPSHTNQMLTSRNYKSNYNLWQVGISNHNDDKSYSFKSLADDCYLTDSDGDLKCLALDSDSYWVANRGSRRYHGNVGDKKRYYTSLESDYHKHCVDVDRTQHGFIKTSENYCDREGAWVLFEIVKGGPDSASAATVSDKKFLGIGNINGLNNGNIVTIRGFRSGLLGAQSSGDKIRTVDIFEDDIMMWIVGYDEGRKAYYFQNYDDRSCYMTNSGGNELKCSSLNNKSYWVNGGNYVHSGDSSDYRRVYTSMKNYDTKKCLKIESTEDGTIDLRGNECGPSVRSWVRFEIVTY